MDTTVLDRLSAFYPRLGNAIAEGAPDGWREVWVQAEIDDDQRTVACYAATDGAAQPRYFEASGELERLLVEMRESAALMDAKHAWTTATAMLDRSGRFSIDYGYDPVPLDGVVARRQAWKARYLPSA